MSSSAGPLRNERQIGQYILEEKLGEGGMAEVWRARNQVLGTYAAIKFLISGFAGHAETEQRFLGEGKRQAQLRHPNIVSAFDFIYLDGRSYLVMEYIHGQNLDDLLFKMRAPMPLADVLSISRDVLSALGYAHSRDVIHRDIKPSNILIENSGRAMVMDFGIALAAGEQRLTRAGMAIGTPEYMSPEQIVGAKAIDRRSDIYSYGCVLYQMLTQHPPFQVEQAEGHTDYVIQEMHLHRPPVPLRQLNPQVPDYIDLAVLRCLEKNASDRFGSCEELLQEITRVSPRQTHPLTMVEQSAVAGGTPSLPSRQPILSESRFPVIPQVPQMQTSSSKVQGAGSVTAAAPSTKLTLGKFALWIVCALVCVVLAAGGVYIYQHQQKEAATTPIPASQTTAPSAEDATNQPPVPNAGPPSGKKANLTGESAKPVASAKTPRGSSSGDPSTSATTDEATNLASAPDSSVTPAPPAKSTSAPPKPVPSTPAQQLTGEWQGQYKDYGVMQITRVTLHLSDEDATTLNGTLTFIAAGGNSGSCSTRGGYDPQRQFLTLHIASCGGAPPKHLQGRFGVAAADPTVRTLVFVDPEHNCVLELDKQ